MEPTKKQSGISVWYFVIGAALLAAAWYFFVYEPETKEDTNQVPDAPRSTPQVANSENVAPITAVSILTRLRGGQPSQVNNSISSNPNLSNISLGN